VLYDLLQAEEDATKLIAALRLAAFIERTSLSPATRALQERLKDGWAAGIWRINPVTLVYNATGLGACSLSERPASWYPRCR
jgi:hypothetical protein